MLSRNEKKAVIKSVAQTAYRTFAKAQMEAKGDLDFSTDEFEDLYAECKVEGAKGDNEE